MGSILIRRYKSNSLYMSHHSQHLPAALWSTQTQHSQTCWALETLGHLWMHSYSLCLHPGDLAGNGCFSEEPRNTETVSHWLHLRVLCSQKHSLHSAALQSKTSWRQLKAPAPSGKLQPPDGIQEESPETATAAGEISLSLSLSGLHPHSAWANTSAMAGGCCSWCKFAQLWL